MQTASLVEILKEINVRIEHHPLSELQAIRKVVYGNERRGSKTVFRKPRPDRHYIFHSGGRAELQFNIGIEEGKKVVRFGVAYSLRKDQTLTSIDNLRPSIKLFNEYIDKNRAHFSGMIMSHTGSLDYKPRKIPDQLISEGMFIFLGVRLPIDTIDYDYAANVLNALFPLYLHTVTINLNQSKQKAVDALILLDEDEESAYPEGIARYRMHRSLERDPGISRRAKEKRKAEGKLTCEVCEFDFEEVYGSRGDGYIEAHHKVPVSLLDGRKKTRVSDIALVCSNCHRMLHRGTSLLSIKQLKTILKK